MQPFNYLVGKPEVKVQHGRIRDRWEDTIKTYLKEVGCEYVLWVYQVEESGRWRNLLKIEIKLRYP
jgi:hypothetical protein